MNKTSSAIFCIFLFSISSIAQPTIRAAMKNASCSGKPDGSLDLQIIGKSPFKIVWSNGESSAKVSDLSEGSYSVIVTDANGQSSKQIFNIRSESKMDVKIDILPSSNGDYKDITINVSGGAPSYTYYVSSFSRKGTQRMKQQEQIFRKLEKRNYTIDVEDINGCISTTTIDLR